MNPFDSQTDVNIPVAIFAGACFAFVGWYYFFQPRSFQRAMELVARKERWFADSLRFWAKPIGILSFAIAGVLLAVALKHLIA